MKTLKNQNYRAAILKKDGTIKDMYKNVIDSIFVGRKIYPKKWQQSGRHINLINRWPYCTNLIAGLGYTYQVGNDSPKGGIEGDYMKITNKCLTAVKNFRNNPA